MPEKRLGVLLTGIVTARLLFACGGESVAGTGDDTGSGGTAGPGTGGSSRGGSAGHGFGGAGGSGAGTGGAAGSGALGGTGALGGSGAVGGNGAVGGTGAVGGSGAAGGMGGAPPSPVVALGCGGDSAMPRLAEGLHLPEPVDYLAVYQHGVAEPLDSTGVRCDGAADLVLCETAYASAVAGYTPPLSRPVAIPYAAGFIGYVAFTRGDQVGIAPNIASVSKLLGEIDTPNEALLSFLVVAGYATNCQALYEYDGGYFTIVNTTPTGCGPGYLTHRLQVTTPGAVTAVGFGTMVMGCIGRRPRGFELSTLVTDAPAAGRYYARIAELEAAAVIAFDFMLAEFTEAGAPESLLRRVEDARHDEVRHARVMATLAGSYGATVKEPRVAPRPTPTLLEMALENVTEGCVRETWGALSARYQSHTAERLAERLIWGEIADDEARHAELSWELHAWLMSQLAREAQLEVEAAQQRAWDELVLELAADPEREVQRVAGVPSRSTALELARELAIQLQGWSPAQLAA